ncbi:uncharacterized protein LOC134774443 [Penaeus indicus]|uniref:uncharacterized protein LOC134774443 n=1 Tax=Penaeus indicus TaxID=29960 RepID=UPI00300C0C4E
MYEKLDTKEGGHMVYRVAKQRDRAAKDVQQIRLLKNAEDKVLNIEAVLQRWKDYFEGLMNVENPREVKEEVMVSGVTQDEMLMEMYREGQRQLDCVFIDLEKAYDRLTREGLWHCIRESSISAVYVRMVQDMYNVYMTVVRSAVGTTEGFRIEVGLHQGSTLSPILFAVIMDTLTDGLRKGVPWYLMFADDNELCSESTGEVEDLERWRHGMNVSRRKTEYLCVKEKEGDGRGKMQGKEIKKMNEFKYLGSTVVCEGSSTAEVKRRVQARWNVWRKVTGQVRQEHANRSVGENL